jgi:predicted ATP-binding protein involved in virulence
VPQLYHLSAHCRSDALLLCSVLPQRRDFLDSFVRFDVYKDALDAKADFRQFLKYFYFLEQLEKERIVEQKDFAYTLPQLNAIRRAIKIALPYVSTPRIKQNPLRFLINWHQNNEILRIEQLSDGYRIIVAMIADIAARMAGA